MPSGVTGDAVRVSAAGKEGRCIYRTALLLHTWRLWWCNEPGRSCGKLSGWFHLAAGDLSACGSPFYIYIYKGEKSINKRWLCMLAAPSLSCISLQKRDSCSGLLSAAHTAPVNSSAVCQSLLCFASHALLVHLDSPPWASVSYKVLSDAWLDLLPLLKWVLCKFDIC